MRGIDAFFGRDAQPHVVGKRHVDRAVRFDVHAPSVGAQRIDQRARLGLRERFAASQNDRPGESALSARTSQRSASNRHNAFIE